MSQRSAIKAQIFECSQACRFTPLQWKLLVGLQVELERKGRGYHGKIDLFVAQAELGLTASHSATQICTFSAILLCYSKIYGNVGRGNYQLIRHALNLVSSHQCV